MYPVGMPSNFAFGGMLNLEDIPGKRKAGSMMWSGVANSHWVRSLTLEPLMLPPLGQSLT